MSRRINIYGICFISSLCILLLLASHRFSGSVNYRPVPDFRRTIQSFSAEHPSYSNQAQNLAAVRSKLALQQRQIDLSQNQTFTISDIVNLQRNKIEMEMADYEFPNGKYGMMASKLSDLQLESGGKPIRNVIITTWRSGSTFLGDILNAIPGNYYHYEPLLNYDIVQIRGPPHAKQALKNLKKLLNCDYHDMEEYLDYGMDHIWLFTHNERLWDQCLDFPQVCWNATFLTKFCKLFPFQSMKVVRLRLKLAEELLGDDIEGPRILLLVRDPRGALQSRRHRAWCPGMPDCDRPALLCADMVSDYVAAIRMAALHPKRFRVLRYEDLSLDPYKIVSSLLEFFGLDFHPKVREFLDTHTKLDLGGVSSTFRNSKSAPFHWTKDLDFDDVWAIQNECTEAMSHWGYKPAHNRSHLLSKEFNPLGEYSIA